MIQNENIYTDGTYFRNNPTWDVEDSNWKADLIFKIIKKNNIQVNEITDVGCGAGKILLNLSSLLPQAKRFRGYDISLQAINLASQQATEKLSFTNEDFLQLSPATKTDLLLLIDVMEHVEDYYGFMQKLLSRSKYFVFHIPLDLSCRTILKPHVLLQQRIAVGHLHYFSREMIEWLLKDTGYSILDWHYTKPTGDILKSRSFRQGVKKFLRNISYSIHPGLSDKLWGGYSMLILAQNKNA